MKFDWSNFSEAAFDIYKEKYSILIKSFWVNSVIDIFILDAIIRNKIKGKLWYIYAKLYDRKRWIKI